MTKMRRVMVLGVTAISILSTSRVTSAQTNGWQVDVAPLYFWGATTSGNIAINGTRDIPVYMDFSDAAKNLAGAFMFRGEARKGPWGLLGDVFLIRLSSDVNYTTPILSLPLAGTLKLDQTIFNGKITYEVTADSRFYVVGGMRTLTMAPTIRFTGPVGGQLAEIDISRTVAAAVGGVIYRPKLSDRIVLLTQADIGGGSAFTTSATGAIEFLITRWVGLAAGYNLLRIDTGSVPKSGTAPVNAVETGVTQYGPVFTLAFHWAEK
ncbi:MAG TPA: hypothetical protein VFT39_06810 [Vicinamibacterales bacterium]|nr:hypothetical protein [Vicinamibacterales bacterium]